jgi:transcriptional regulator with XRE-family HTH domain
MPRHPIDAAIRERLRTLNLKQRDVAKAVGRTPAWVSKYLHGKGHATVDELIRIIAIALGVEGMSDLERRLLKAWKRLPPASQTEAVEWFEDWVRRDARLARKRR